MGRFLMIGNKKFRPGTAKYYLFKEFLKGKYPLELLSDYAEGYESKRSKKVYRKVKKETIYRYYEEFKALMRTMVYNHQKELREVYLDFAKQFGRAEQDVETVKKAEKEYLAWQNMLEEAYEDNRWDLILRFSGANSLKAQLERLKSSRRY